MSTILYVYVICKVRGEIEVGVDVMTRDRVQHEDASSQTKTETVKYFPRKQLMVLNGCTQRRVESTP